MSWDVLLQKFPHKTARPEQAPANYRPPAVGTRAQVAAAVRKLFRGTISGGDAFLTVDRSAFAIEISLGEDEPCSQLLLHVHDDHAAATKAILRLAGHFGMRALDCSSSEFIEAERSGGNRKPGAKKRENKARPRRIADEHAQEPVQAPLEHLSGVETGPLERCIYLSFLPAESPKQLQKAVFRHWGNLGNGHDDLDAGIRGPMYVLTLPDGEMFGDIYVCRYPVLVTETEAEMIPRLQKGAALVHAFAAATGRRSGEIANGSFIICNGGQRIPLARCAYRRLWTDADYARKVKGRKKG